MQTTNSYSKKIIFENRVDYDSGAKNIRNVFGSHMAEGINYLIQPKHAHRNKGYRPFRPNPFQDFLSGIDCGTSPTKGQNVHRKQGKSISRFWRHQPMFDCLYMF